MADKTKSKKTDSPTEESAGGGVVQVRQVVTRPMSLAEQLERSGAPRDAEAEYPNAPKPQPRNEYRPMLKQMKRKHKRPGSEPKPAFMSDVKV